jgi:hypothetical protein
LFLIIDKNNNKKGAIPYAEENNSFTTIKGRVSKPITE